MSDTPIIPLNSLSRHIQPLEAALVASTSEVIRSGYYVLGPGVNDFESAFAEYCGAEHCIGVANGTDALELALKAVGVAAGDQVVVTANAAMYGATAVLACGAHPLFVDVEAVGSTMCPTQLAAVLAEHAPKAVIVTHLYGRLAAIEALVRLCHDQGVAVVEDCAQAHGARRNDRVAGSFGDIAAFSFYPTKNLGALGDGGAVVTSDPALAQRTRQLRQYGWSAKYSNELGGGRNSRLDEIQARMLHLMLPLLDGWNDRRREVANRYSGSIKHTDIVVAPAAGEEYVGHLYVVHSARRDALREHLHAHRIQTDIHYPVPDHRQPCHAGSFDSVRLPVTELQASTALTLPCFPELDDTEVQRVIDACNQF